MAIVKITTSYGDVLLRLYDETPKHRDNFLKLVAEGYYDGTLFHRVIENFMIQGGDPDSKDPRNQQLGVGGPDYTLEAEILPTFFHKRGALAAARQGDEINPDRRSSGSQFYIVWGQVYNAGQLRQLEKQLCQQAEQQIFERLATEHRDEIMNLRRSRDRDGLMALQEKLIQTARSEAKLLPPALSEDAKRIYETEGGAPFLDGQYTIFGEVLEGLSVIERIQQVETGAADRPLEDIPMTISVVEG